MIQKSSLLVSLSMSQWGARKHDKKITDEVAKQHNASSDAGRYNKLLIKKEHLDKVQKAASKARLFHYDNTLPWGDNNERLLPAKNYFDYVSEMGSLKGEFESAVREFLSNYDTVIEEAKVRLNGMFNPSDYPSRLEIENKFAFKTIFMPVPETDFQLNLSEEEINKLKESVEAEVTNRLSQAVADTWSRIKEQLAHMKDRLSDKDAIFKDSLFGNLKELLSLLPKLNVTEDENLTLACAEMSNILADPDAIRGSVLLRQRKAEEVDKVLNQFSQFFPS